MDRREGEGAVSYCAQVRLPDGSVAHVRMSGSRSTKPPDCRWCFSVHTFLCDHPLAGGGTCDAPMCSLHAKEVGVDRHLCPDHAPGAPAQLSLEVGP